MDIFPLFLILTLKLGNFYIKIQPPASTSFVRLWKVLRISVRSLRVAGTSFQMLLVNLDSMMNELLKTQKKKKIVKNQNK